MHLLLLFKNISCWSQSIIFCSSISSHDPAVAPDLHTAAMAGSKENKCREWLSNDDGSTSNLQKTVAELLGTYVLVFVGCASTLTDKVLKLTMVGIAMVWGGVLMALIYTVGHISGAHFNPAVTLAFAAGRRFPWKHVPMYILAQVLGATLASLTLRALFNDQGNIRPTLTSFADTTSDLEAIAWEFIITAILMFAICGVASDHRASKDFAGVSVGATLMVNALIAGPITGASMNPARSLGPALVSGVYKNLWVYIVSPILGAMAGILFYSILRVPNPETNEDNKIKSNNQIQV